jgi:predicted transcriptional regulator
MDQATETTLVVRADADRQRIPEYERLTPAKIALILRLAQEDQTQTAIAQIVGCTQPTVSRCLKEFADTRELAKLKAHNAAERLTKRVLDEADVDQSLEVLDRIGVLEKREHGKTPSVQVNVGVSLG